jgi:hypothetical protein
MVETLMPYWVCVRAITADSWNVRAGHVNINRVNNKGRDKRHTKIATVSMLYHEDFIATEILKPLSL